MSDDRRQHLEFIQNNIARMNQASFQVKGMAIAILTALLAAYVAVPVNNIVGNRTFLFVAIVPTLIFWILDTYYLQQEKKFRGVYEDAIKIQSGIALYDMPLDKYKHGKYGFLRCMFTKTEWILYLPVIIGLIILGIIL